MAKQVTRAENDRLLKQAAAANRRNTAITVLTNLVFVGFAIYYLVKFVISCQQHIAGSDANNTCDPVMLANLHAVLTWMMLFNLLALVVFKPQWQAQATSVVFTIQRMFWAFFTAGSLIGLHFAAKAVIKFIGDPGPISTWLTSIYHGSMILAAVNDFFGLLVIILFMIGGGFSIQSAEDAAWGQYASSPIHWDLKSILNSH